MQGQELVDEPCGSLPTQYVLLFSENLLFKLSYACLLCFFSRLTVYTQFYLDKISVNFRGNWRNLCIPYYQIITLSSQTELEIDAIASLFVFDGRIMLLVLQYLMKECLFLVG